MKKLISTLVLFVGFVAGAIAQTTPGEIKGTVYDENGDPMYAANVWVELFGNKIGAATDFDGKFTIKPLDPGTYTVYISSVSYETLEITGVAVNPNKITWMKNNQMKINTTTTTVFTKVEYKNPLIKPEDPTAMTVLSAELETRTDIKTPTQMIANLTSEVKMADNGQQIIVRGARPDASAFYVDGVKMQVLTGVPPSSIGSVTVYTGGVPAKYGDLTGGVVVVESKSYFDLYRERNAQRNNRKK